LIAKGSSVAVHEIAAESISRSTDSGIANGDASTCDRERPAFECYIENL